MYRVSDADADAIGKEPNAETQTSQEAGDGTLSEEQVWAALKNVYDPEIPVNIVDLGLVYDMQLQPLPSGESKVEVKMTLTAPGCGMGPAIPWMPSTGLRGCRGSKRPTCRSCGILPGDRR